MIAGLQQKLWTCDFCFHQELSAFSNGSFQVFILWEKPFYYELKLIGPLGRDRPADDRQSNGTRAGALPTQGIGIPLQLTAQMRASGGHSVNFTGFVPVDAELLPVNLHNAPVAIGQLLQGNPPGLPKLAAQPPDGPEACPLPAAWQRRSGGSGGEKIRRDPEAASALEPGPAAAPPQSQRRTCPTFESLWPPAS